MVCVLSKTTWTNLLLTSTGHAYRSVFFTGSHQNVRLFIVDVLVSIRRNLSTDKVSTSDSTLSHSRALSLYKLEHKRTHPNSNNKGPIRCASMWSSSLRPTENGHIWDCTPNNSVSWLPDICLANWLIIMEPSLDDPATDVWLYVYVHPTPPYHKFLGIGYQEATDHHPGVFDIVLHKTALFYLTK